MPGIYTEGLPEGSSIKDSWAHGDLPLTATGVLMNSSNIGTAILAQKLSKQERHDYLEAFGFNSDTAVDFLGESSGSVLPMDQTDAITNLTQQFGQGMSATSAQIASLYQTHRQRRRAHAAHPRRGLRVAGRHLDPDSRRPRRTRVVSESAADTTVQMMEVTANQGSLKNVLDDPRLPGRREDRNRRGRRERHATATTASSRSRASSRPATRSTPLS